MTAAERTDALLPVVLTIGLLVSIVAGSFIVGAELHPLAGAGLALVGFATWWRVDTARRAEQEIRAAAAAARGRDAAALDAGFDGPAPPAPWTSRGGA